MMMPTNPAAGLVLVEAAFPLGRLNVLLDRPQRCGCACRVGTTFGAVLPPELVGRAGCLAGPGKYFGKIVS
jgi:hypothetical protein